MMRLQLPLILLAGLLLSGCDVRQRFSSPEARINEAMPLGLPLRQAFERTAEQLGQPSAGFQELESAWVARLRARALTCSPNFSPTWRQSETAVREAVKDKACFEEFDRGLQRWLGMQRARWLLAQPPAVADDMPPSVTLRGHSNSLLREQLGSPVLASALSDGLELVALASGRVLLKESGTSGEVTVSPNGRLFAQAAGGVVKVRASEGGETLFELSEANAVHWLGADFMGVRSSKGKAALLLNLRSDKAVPIPTKSHAPPITLFPMPSGDKTFAVLTYEGLQRFKWSEAEGQTAIVLEAERAGVDMNHMVLMQSPGQFSLDGHEWLFAARGKLVRLDLRSLEYREQGFEPLDVDAVSPATQEGQYVLALSMHGAISRNGNYLFDARQGTLARIGGPGSGSRFRYLPALKRLAHGGPSAVWLQERLDLAMPQPIAEVTAGFIDEANKSKLAAAAIEERQLSLAQAPLPGSPLLPLVQGAYVEGVGVYEASEKVAQPGQSRSTGKVVVNVRRTRLPMVLVLTSYEPVQWNLRMEPGAKLSLVLLGSYYPSTVVGADSTRVVQIGRTYAYKQEDPEFSALQRQVNQQTGRTISVFQGNYSGTSFSVGGN